MLDRETNCYSNSCAQLSLELQKRSQGMELEIDRLQYTIKKLQQENKQLLVTQKEMIAQNQPSNEHPCNYNYNCNCQFTATATNYCASVQSYSSPYPSQFVIDPCTRYKVKIQNLEIELDKKTQCLNELQQEKRRLINEKIGIEKENFINKTGLDNSKEKLNDNGLAYDFFKKEQEKFEEEVEKLQAKIEKLNDSLEKAKK